MNSPMTRRAMSVSIASSAGQLEGGRHSVTSPPGGSRSDVGRFARAPVQTGLGPARPSCQAIPARSAMIRRISRSWSSGRSSRSSGSRDPLAPDIGRGDVDDEQALVVHRGGSRAAPGRAMTSEPPQNEIDSSTPDPVAEHDERRRQLGVGAHQRPPRRRGAQPDLVRGRQVATGRRRDVDEDLGAVQREDLRDGEVPEVLADRRSRGRRPRRDGTARSMSPAREEAAFVEEAVGRQEQLAVDVPDLAVLEQRRRDEQPVVGRLLDERDDRGKALGGGARSASRGSSSRSETSAARSWSW